MRIKTFVLDLPDDFLLLCELSGYHPQFALQYFIDQVSLPKMLSNYPVDPNRAATKFVYLHAKRNDLVDLLSDEQQQFAEGYLVECLRMMEIDNGLLSQSELEVQVRKKLILYWNFIQQIVLTQKDRLDGST